MIWALHGMFGSAADWGGCDVRGVELFDEVAPFEEWSAKFAARVRKEGREPSLLGYSMGGRLALHALLAAPDLWRSAVIVSAHPGLEEAGEREARVTADAGWARRVREEPLQLVLRDWERREVFGGGSKAFDVKALESRREAVARSFEAWSLGRQEALWERLGEVTCPVLWVTGARDEKFTKLGRRAAGLMPRGELVVMEGCGHRVCWEDPGDFWRNLSGWWAGNDD